MNSASLSSLAGQYDKPIPPQCLAPIDFLKIPALDSCSSENRKATGKAPCLISCLLATVECHRLDVVFLFLREVLILVIYIKKGTRPGKSLSKLRPISVLNHDFQGKRAALLQKFSR
jgi:hypothetical protein